jgi:hypothetical protein
MSSFFDADEGLEETQFVDAVNGYDSSVNDDSVINGEILEEEEEEEPFEKEPEQEQEEQAEEQAEEEEKDEKKDEEENITFTVTDGSMNYFREYYTSHASMGSVPKYKDASMNNINRDASVIQQPIPRRPNSRVFNRPVLRPGHHLKTMFF